MPDQQVTEGNALTVEFDVQNRGDATDTQDIELKIDNTTEDKIQSVKIAPGETYSDILAWLTENGDAQAADYTAAVVTDDREDTISVNVS